jgi:hypothetical protein
MEPIITVNTRRSEIVQKIFKHLITWLKLNGFTLIDNINSEATEIRSYIYEGDNYTIQATIDYENHIVKAPGYRHEISLILENDNNFESVKCEYVQEIGKIMDTNHLDNLLKAIKI